MIHGSCSAASRSVASSLLLAAVLLSLAGCRSEYRRQVDQAKATAVRTGVAQEVISVDAGGRTTVTVVRPSGAVPTLTTSIATTTTAAGAPLAAGQPDWSNGARPSPGNTVTFSGPQMAAAAPVATAPAPVEAAATREKSHAVPAVAVPTDVVVPAGSSLVLRMGETISAKSNHAGDHFSGELAEGVVEGGRTVLPRGTRVHGIVTEAHRRGRFKGQSTLGLRLTSVAYGGTVYPIATSSLHRGNRGRRKRAVASTGVGAQVRSLATGGVGLAMRGLSGLGSLFAGVAGHRDLQIPAESLVRFQLEDNLTVQPAE